MITKDLIDYIEKELNKNLSQDFIKSKLVEVGWHIDDIEEGFLKVNNSFKKNKNNDFDPYHENINNEEEKTGKIWIPTAIKEVEDSNVDFTSKDIFKKEETSFHTSSKTDIEIFQEEIAPPKEELIPTLIKKEETSFHTSPKTDIEIFQEELIKPKEDVTTFIKKEKTPLPKIKDVVVSKPKIEKNVVNNFTDDLSKIAMISSYSKDYACANTIKQEIYKKKKRSSLRWFNFILILAIIGGLVFIFYNGLIKIPSLDFIFTK